MEEKQFSCVHCGKVTCDSQNFPYPEGCVTQSLSEEELAWAREEYWKEENQKVIQAAAQIEGHYYWQKARVEEMVLFAKKIGADWYCKDANADVKIARYLFEGGEEVPTL